MMSKMRSFGGLNPSQPGEAVRPGLLLALVGLVIVLADSALAFNSTLLAVLADDFAVRPQLLQLTISASLLALGASGIIYGGISAAFGRRKLIFFGVSAFTVGMVGSVFAQSYLVLLLSRIAQGIGAGVAWIIGNAALKDVSDGVKYARAMNQLHVVAGVVLIIAPVVGGLVAAWLGWRGAFGVLAVLAAIGMAVIYMFLPETIKVKEKLTRGLFVDQYRRVFGNKTALKLIAAKVLGVSQLFAVTANLPLIYVQEFGITTVTYGFYLAALFIAYLATASWSVKLCERYSVADVVPWGALLLVVSGIGSLAIHFLGVDNLAIIHAPVTIGFLGLGFLFGNLTSAIVECVGNAAAAAAAVMIALEMLMSGLAVLVLSICYDGTMLPVGLYTLVVAVSVAAFQRASVTA